MATAVLVVAVLLPPIFFWLLKQQFRATDLLAAGVAVLLGWGLNVVWAIVAKESVAIAATLGWLCPSVLVLITWLVMRFLLRKPA